MKLLILFSFLLTGCEALNQYERSYSVSYTDAQGETFSSSVRFRRLPTEGFKK